MKSWVGRATVSAAALSMTLSGLAACGGQQTNTGTDTGQSVRCRFLVMATGPLSTPIDPQLPGLSEFSGRVVRTGQRTTLGLVFHDAR